MSLFILLVLANIVIVLLLGLSKFGMLDFGLYGNNQRNNNALENASMVLIYFLFNAMMSFIYFSIKNFLNGLGKDYVPVLKEKLWCIRLTNTNYVENAEVDLENENINDPEKAAKKIEADKRMRMSESISFRTKFYSFLALYFMLTSLCFFVAKERSATVSPAESRQKNAECTFMIFDNHDIWHFTSAFGILFTSLALLTLEDKNTDTPWDEIRVF